MKLVGRISLGILLWLLVFGWHRTFAQATSGYTLLSNTSSLTYTDTNVTAGSIYGYEVTSTNIFGESTPLGPIAETIPTAPPPTGQVHQVSLSWGASSTTGVTYNVYRITGAVPNPPAAGSLKGTVQ